MLPHGIDRGLRLEMSGVLLAWGSGPSELRSASRPWIFPASWDRNMLIFVWNDRVWNGLPCQITTLFGPGQQTVLDVLRLVPEYPARIRGAPQGWRWLQQELAERFGNPYPINEQTERGEAVWLLGGLEIRHWYCDSMPGGHDVLLSRETGDTGPGPLPR